MSVNSLVTGGSGFDTNYDGRLPSGNGRFATLDGAETLTNKTLTSPSGDGVGVPAQQTKFCTTQFDAVTGTTGTTLTNIVGLTGFNLVAGATYKFELHLAGVATANSGHKIGFKYTTATLTSLESMAKACTASAIAVTHSTTATDQATLHGATTATIDITITGQIVVNAAGTLAVQAAQNAAHADTTSVYVGSYMTLTRIA